MRLVPKKKRAGCLLWQAACRAGKEVSCPFAGSPCGGCQYYAGDAAMVAKGKVLTRAELLARVRERRRRYDKQRSSGKPPGRPRPIKDFTLRAAHPLVRKAYQALYWKLWKETDQPRLPAEERFNIEQYVVRHQQAIIAAGGSWRPPAKLSYVSKTGKKYTLVLPQRGRGRPQRLKEPPPPTDAEARATGSLINKLKSPGK